MSLGRLSDVWSKDNTQLSDKSGMTHGGDCSGEESRVREEDRLARLEH